MGELKLLHQPNGISCGNTVLKMVANYLDVGNNISIEDLIDIMGTDTKTGTTDIKMKKGLDYLKIPYYQNTKEEIFLNDEFQSAWLNSCVENDKLFIMRTTTHGVFHWILIHSIIDNMYQVLDPWLGNIEYNLEQILDIWRVRDYDGFIVPSNPFKIEHILDSDIEYILELADNVFKDSGMNNKTYINSAADWDISIKLVDPFGKIVGFYIFNENQLNRKEYISNGLQGVALGIDPEYKGLGLGKLLINYPIDNMGDRYDYIWGMHLKSLKNIDDWLKRRELISDQGCYITAGFLKKEVINE